MAETAAERARKALTDDMRARGVDMNWRGGWDAAHGAVTAAIRAGEAAARAEERARCLGFANSEGESWERDSNTPVSRAAMEASARVAAAIREGNGDG